MGHARSVADFKDLSTTLLRKAAAEGVLQPPFLHLQQIGDQQLIEWNIWATACEIFALGAEHLIRVLEAGAPSMMDIKWVEDRIDTAYEGEEQHPHPAAYAEYVETTLMQLMWVWLTGGKHPALDARMNDLRVQLLPPTGPSVC